MHKWLWLLLVVVPVVWLSGCGGSDSALNPGEGTGTIAADDFDPFGPDAGPLNLRYFTFPKDGKYQITLFSGPESPALPQPWVMVFADHVEANNVDFLGAYNRGAGVLKQSHGVNSAQVAVKGKAGREFTFSFGSWNGGNGNYSWRVTKL